MYQFWIHGVLLPVTPSSVTIKFGNQDKTFTLINEGQINILKPPGLSKISFNALLPNQQYSFGQYPEGYQPASYYMEHLEKLKNECKPFIFTLFRIDDANQRLAQATPMRVSLESCQFNEDAEKYGMDVMAQIELLQFRAFQTKTLTLKKEEKKTTATVTEKRETDSKPKEETYTVKEGDCLWSIAKKKLGDGSREKEIYSLNKDTIEAAAKKYGKASSSNGRWIYPDTVLKLPT